MHPNTYNLCIVYTDVHIHIIIHSIYIYILYMVHRETHKPLRAQDHTIPCWSAVDDDKLHQELSKFQAESWTCDIETQVQHFNRHVHSALHCAARRERTQCPKKPYIDDDIWQLRNDKNSLKRRLRRIGARGATDIYFAVFRAWKSLHTTGLGFEYRTTLLCKSFKLRVKLHVIAKCLQRKLRHAKQAHIQRVFDQMPDTHSASQILKELRPIIGSSNMRKRGLSALPQVVNEQGEVCTSIEASRDRWIRFFSHMEGGQRVSGAQQRHLWRQGLSHIQADSLDEPLQRVPSLFDLEVSLRRVQPGKAVGRDAIPPELCHRFPGLLGPQIYPQLLKLCCHGAEALEHKGGRLAVAYKRKGPMAHCESYRSLLVSSHIGKTIHRTLRQHQNDLYLNFMQRQQYGGRPKISVGFALHMTRSFLRHCQDHGQSSGLIFLDLTEAFYRVLRPLALGVSHTDEAIASVAHRLQLDPGTLHDLYAVLSEPDALHEASVPRFERRYLQALHQDTYFYLEGQEDWVRTTVGSRPGDSFADVVFGFLWAKVLHKLEQAMAEAGILSSLPKPDLPGLHPTRFDGQVNLLGPTWCDDLCICLQAKTPCKLESDAMLAMSLTLDLCRQHGMTPNLKAGKTEVMLSFRGPGSTGLRRKYYGAERGRKLQALGEHCSYEVHVTGEYRHLGGLLHVSGDLKKEVRRRLAQAHSSLGQHRRILYQNAHINLTKRSHLFQTIVLSQLTYGMESWVVDDVRTKACIHSGIMRLYRRLLKLGPDSTVTDRAVCVALNLPEPSTLLRQCRLRYLGALYKSAPTELWASIHADERWCTLIRDDIQWLWKQLCNSSNLMDPQEDFPHWEHIMLRFPGYWKRLIKRGVLHELGQQRNALAVHAAHTKIFNHLQTFGILAPAVPMPERSSTEPTGAQASGSTYCRKACRNRAGEAVHMARKHGQVSPLRYLYDGTSCPSCLKEFHVPYKVLQHLRTAHGCRCTLRNRGLLPQPAIGMGSTNHKAIEEEHNRLIPWQQTAGPRLPPDRDNVHEDFVSYHIDLAIDIVSLLDEPPTLCASGLEQALRNLISECAISWTFLMQTLCWVDGELSIIPEDHLEVPLATWKSIYSNLRDTSTWPFLAILDRTDGISDGRWEEYAGELAHYDGRVWTPHVDIPRGFSRERIVLHLFSGRRRHGDFQTYLDRDCPAGFTIWTISLDVVVDTTHGDLLREDTRQFWLEAIRLRRVVGILCGPPCETWSKARSQLMDEQHKGPRVIRTPSHPWGLPALSVRELRQLYVGTQLLLFAVEALYLLAIFNGIGLLEHPAEPDELHHVSIWRLCAIALLERFPGVWKTRVFQGHFGAESAKPTDLLTINLPTFEKRLDECRLYRTAPKAASIGRDDQGVFRTSRLKEYPPAFNLAIARSFCDSLNSHVPVDNNVVLPAEFAEVCRKLTLTCYGSEIGPDYAH